MPSIYDVIINEAKRRKIAYVENYFPFYIASIGCHMFNLMNQSKRIYIEGGSIPNTRLHILFVTLPGFGKSFFLRQFLEHENYSILKGSHIPCSFEGNMSEAGFTGTIRLVEGQKDPVVTEGLCKKESSSIIGIEEFSAITNAFQQNFNVGLDTSLLLALDSGNVVKRLAGGKIGYHTNVTLWAGVQPARYDLTSGFSRRFIFMTFYPTIKDIDRYRKARRDMKGVTVNKINLKSIHLAIGNRFKDIHHNLKKIYFHQNFYTELNKMDVMHYDDELFERLAIGYWLMKVDKIQDQLQIVMDAELRRLIHLCKWYKDEVRTATPTKMVWNMIKDEKKIWENRLISVLIATGMEIIEIKKAINNLIIRKNIKKDGKGYLIILQKT